MKNILKWRVSNLKAAIFCKNPEMCIKIKKCICSVSVHCGITVRITVFDDWDKIIEMFSKRPNFFDLAVLCCGEDDEMTVYAKKLRDCDKNFDLMVIGKSKKQLYSLFELRICSFVFEKDVDEYLQQQFVFIFSNTEKSRDECYAFEILEPISLEKIICVSDILFFDVNDKMIHIHTVAGLYKLKRCTLGSLAQQMKKYGFIQVNRSHLINIRHIRSINGKVLEMDNGYTAEISRRQQKNVEQEFFVYYQF